ncbi:unnamed protein product [Malus baccata var. baccata]
MKKPQLRLKYLIGKKEANPLTLDLRHAVTSLSAELHQKDIHFLVELIQNAEDNEYEEGVEPTREFVMTKEDITGSGAPATIRTPSAQRVFRYKEGEGGSRALLEKKGLSSMIERMQWEKIDARNGLIGRGLVKTILAVLAGPEVNMSLRDRHKAANSVVMLSVSKNDKPIQVYCRLMPSAATAMEVRKQKMFLTSFAIELTQELLAPAEPTGADKLSKLIQMGLMFDISEGEVDCFLNAAFVTCGELGRVYEKHSGTKLEQLGPSTPMPSCKKQRQ